MKNGTDLNKNLIKISDDDLGLKETIRKYDALINNLPGTVYRCKNNRNWVMEFISEQCEYLTGYTADEFLNGKVHFTDIILEEDQKRVWNQTQKGIERKELFNLEYKIKTKDGQLKHLWEQGGGVFDTNGELLAIEGYITDITSQKKAEKALRANQVKNKALLKAIPDVMFIQDYHSNYLDFYAPEKNKLAIQPEEIIGKNMKDIFPLDVFEKVRKAQEKTIEDKSLQLVEFSLTIKNEISYFEARIVPMNSHSLLTIVRDVTETQAKDTSLRIKNNALSSASNGIIIADAQQQDLPIIYCNEAFEKMTGYPKDKVLGRNCQFLQNDDRDQEEINTMRNAMAKGRACNVILRNYKNNGELFWNEVTITPVYDEEKKLTHFICVQNDVTDKIKEKHLKDQIRKILELIAQDKSLETITNKIIETAEAHFKSCKASVLVLNRERKTLKFVVPNMPIAFSQLLEGISIGQKRDSSETDSFLIKEIIISNIETDIFYEDYKEIKEVALKNGIKAFWIFPVMSSTNHLLGTFIIYSKNSKKPSLSDKEIILDLTHLASVAIEKHNTALALKENKIELENYAHKLEEKIQERTQEVMATVQKLVESNLNLEDQILVAKLAEKKAMASETIASTIAQNFPNGFITVIDKNFKILFAEGEALTQLGLKQVIFNDMAIDDLIVFSEKRKKRIKKDILKTLNGQHLNFEMEYKNRYYSVNTAPLFDGDEKVTSALLVYSDISQQKAEEQSIKNALKKEKELNDLKSRFISMASHEFRTPLSAILTSAVLIGKQNEPGKELKREKYIAQIENNVKNLTVILNDFLSLSKLEEGKIRASLEQFDLIHFSKMIVRETKFRLKQNQNINFYTDLDNLLVQLDPKLLRHVFANLLSNASKYSPENTSIDVKITTNHKTVLIEIEDQGIGIPKEEQKDLFQRFFRAKNATNIEGTGLGLNIVKQYVKLMNGSVGFKSELNVGSTFYIVLPIKQ